MAIKQLHKVGLITHVVSQNCDGLHLRSGLPSKALSEVHGNMYIEVCPKCKPLKQYIRLFDVTERTGLHRHNTGRFCKKCGTELKDTIVHFSEKGVFQWPLNWKGATKAVTKADTILCLGSSLKVLKRYQCLWATDKPPQKRPKLYIVNLQWTPKDSHCTLKIHGKCDHVMDRVMSLLNIEVPKYEKKCDPIFTLATPLKIEEVNTTTRRPIAFPANHTIVKSERVRKRRPKSTTKEKLHYGSHDHKVSHIFTEESENCKSDTVIIGQQQQHVKVNTSDDLSRTVLPYTDDGRSLGWYGKGYKKWKNVKKRKLK